MRRKLAVLCGVLVVAVAPVLVACDDSQPKDDAGPPSPPPYGVLRPRDAVDAVEGEDYEIVHELASYEVGGVVAVLADGRLVTDVNPQTSSIDFDAYVLFLVDPASGDYDRLPAPWLRDGAGYHNTTLLDDDRLLVTWSVPGRGAPQQRGTLMDLATGDHEGFDVPVPRLAGRIKVLGIPSSAGDGRLWYQTGIVTCGDGECADPRQGMLWSFAPGDERPRRELSAVHFAVHGDLLAWTEERHFDTVHVRDLTTGDERHHTVDGDCGVDHLVASDALVVAVCESNYGRQVVIDAEARPVVDLRLSYEYASVGERWVLISPYAYDTETGKLVRLFRRGPGADQTRELFDDVAVLPLGESNVVGTFAHWGVVRLRSAR